jgi:8-oxo-dGTP diphosphatase
MNYDETDQILDENDASRAKVEATRRLLNESEKKLYTYKYPRPSVTVDLIILGRDKLHGLHVLLIKRSTPNDAFPGMWAFPGGFVNVSDEGGQGESCEDAALRELREETGLKNLQPFDLEQVCVASKPGRDPRGRVISIVYSCEIDKDAVEIQAGDDAAEAKWFPISTALDTELAFDHHDILALPVYVESRPLQALQALQALQNMLSTIESDERINENKRMGAVAALQWVLGDDKALDAIMDMLAVRSA